MLRPDLVGYCWWTLCPALAMAQNGTTVQLPRNRIEKHAYETYTKYSAYHPEDTKIAEIAQDELNHSRELKKAMLMIA